MPTQLTSEDVGKIARGFAQISTQKLIPAKNLVQGLSRLNAGIASARARRAWHRGRVNLFEILERRNKEQLRSNVFAWLLDPAESHGCGDQLLRAIFGHLHVTMPRFSWTSVQRECCLDADNRVDILVRTDTFWIAFENKINAPEGPDQLRRYRDCLAATGELNANRFLVYVTPGPRSTLDGACAVSWSKLAELVADLEPNAAADPLVRHIVRDFAETLST